MNKINYDSTGDSLFSVESIEDESPVTCLGIEFENDRARKEYFLNLLAEKLKDPDFRKIEGFPIGSDDDILALSDPPYYCACPNPWINDFIKEWESEKPAKPADWVYKREPFAADVSEGKNDPIYNVHTYHTKVPPKAIMKYILHFTDPGDIVLDGFCGSGMTGVAAYRCGSLHDVQEIGEEVSESKISVGVRHAILNDLSPAAYFISKNFNSPFDWTTVKYKAKHILETAKRECGWMFSTRHNDGRLGEINYVVWSDVYTCPTCGNEIVYFDEAVVMGKGTVKASFTCPHCGTELNKKKMNQVFETSYDAKLDKIIEAAKYVPIFINYSVEGKTFTKKPDSNDLEIINKVGKIEIPYWYPTDEVPKGDKTGDAISVGIKYVHEFYTKRNLYALATLWHYSDSQLKFLLTSFLSRNLTKMNRFVVNSYNPNGRINGPFTGTFYIPSEQVEQNAFMLYKEKMIKSSWDTSENTVSISSSTNLYSVPNNSIDYIFVDPPFGANLMYSELSFIWESWMGVRTNSKDEAIQNKTQHKTTADYKILIMNCFKEFYRVLKKGRWITIEFSNTNNAIWNAIQTSLDSVGFIVANVSILDKKHGGVKAMTNQTSVKQDLIISAYKPDETFESQVVGCSGLDAVWNFIRKHLEYLPVVKEIGEINKTYSVVSERDPRTLYDRLVSYFVGQNILLPISSPDFLAELSNHFIERDGLYYLPEQVAYYDKLKAQNKIGDEDTTGSLFVHDESSAITWIREQLKKKSMTTGEMTPLFMQELNSWDKNEKRLELAEILEENFLKYDGVGDVPSPIHSYLSTNYKELRNMDKDNPSLMAKAKGRWYVPDPNKQADLEKLREKGLLREFNGYLQTKGKLKEFRLEAVRAGFKKAWSDKDYKLIMDFAARIPSSVIEEDPKLLMWYNGAVTRSER